MNFFEIPVGDEQIPPQQVYLVEGLECTLEEIKEANEFSGNDELFQMIAQLEVGHTIGEGLNMATITRIK